VDFLGDVVFELDRHADILSSETAVSGSDALCQAYRQSYHHCFWCAQNPFDRCFDERNSPTCVGQNEDWSTNPIIDAQPYCSFIEQFYFFQGSQRWNLEQHRIYLHPIHADLWLCDIIGQVYHRCYWCTQIKKQKQIPFAVGPYAAAATTAATVPIWQNLIPC